MSNRWRTLLLLVLLFTVASLTQVRDLAAESGLICELNEPPIPCSTFNDPPRGCYYTYVPEENCCVASHWGCWGVCC